MNSCHNWVHYSDDVALSPSLAVAQLHSHGHCHEGCSMSVTQMMFDPSINTSESVN
jgi:hypothetical protein